MDSVRVSVRAGAVCFGLAGAAVAGGLPWHPNIFARPVADVVRDFPTWTTLHAVGVAVAVLTFLGAAALVAAHGTSLGRPGQVGLLVTLIGIVATAALSATEAIVFPVLADRAPELLGLDGPLLSNPLSIGVGVLALCWLVGLVVLGFAAARARVFGRLPGLILAVSALAFVAFEGPFVPVAGIVASVVFGLAQLWWAWLLWFRPQGARAGAGAQGPLSPP